MASATDDSAVLIMHDRDRMSVDALITSLSRIDVDF